MSVCNGTRAIRCRYLFFFSFFFYLTHWVSFALSVSAHDVHSQFAGERCSLFEIWFILLYLFCAYTLYIFVSRIIAAAQRKWNNHICTCREVYIQHQSIYFIRNLNGKTIQIHSDDCCLSLRALPISDFLFPVAVVLGFYVREQQYANPDRANSNRIPVYSWIQFASISVKRASLNPTIQAEIDVPKAFISDETK